MALAEPASTSLGIRYAPDNPTLPKPWKGLIDEAQVFCISTGTETNVNQYDKRATVPPPCPQGPPHLISTPKLAPMPMAHTMQPNGMGLLMGQQSMHAHNSRDSSQCKPQQQGKQMSQLSQQYGQVIAQQQGPLVAHVSQQRGSQSGQQ